MPVFHIKERSDWNAVLNYARGLNFYPKRGFQVSVRNENRTDAQNRLLWSLLGDFVKQGANIDGKTFDTNQWKVIFMKACCFSSKAYAARQASPWYSVTTIQIERMASR